MQLVKSYVMIKNSKQLNVHWSRVLDETILVQEARIVTKNHLIHNYGEQILFDTDMPFTLNVSF